VRVQPSTLHQLLRVPLPDAQTAAVSMSRDTSGSRSHAVFLAEASKRLAASLDVDDTLRCMAELSVPELGTACLVYSLADGRSVSGVVARHRDPRREELLVTRGHEVARQASSCQVLLSVASSGRSMVLSQVSTADLVGDDLGARAALLVPVMAHDRMLAVIALLSERIRQYGPSQVRLGEELTGRFALALDAAQTHRACTTRLTETEASVATSVHDLMSPLTYIKVTAQRLRRLEGRIADQPTSTELQVRLEAIDAAATRMAAAMLALVRTTRARGEVWPCARTTATDLVALVRHTVAEQQVMASQHSIILREAPATLEGPWDADHIERTLSNLIGNGVKYSAPGTSVEVSVTSEVNTEGRWAILQVCDQGIGIPSGDLPFIFEPFRRGSNVGTVSGTGLGLASVWQAVKTHAGRLWVESEVGRGTRITVRLPLAPPTSNNAGQSQSGMR
jgi:signal transduction histidine kinase